MGRGLNVAMVVVALAGCAEPVGPLTVLLEAESTITDGIDPGSAEEDIVDGWSVRYSKYIVAIGDVRLARSAQDLEVEAPTAWIVDLTRIPAGGVEIADFPELTAARWDRFEYAMRAPDESATAEEVSDDDARAMRDNGWTYLVEGMLERSDGVSCPPDADCRAAPRLAFRFGARVESTFGPCQAEDGLPGASVTEGGAAVAITLHGDHVFFDRFPSGAEVIHRRAQWLANADLDGDDAITEDELARFDAAEAFPLEHYHLAGAPLPIETAWDFVRAALATQGHFQGEGECPWMLAP